MKRFFILLIFPILYGARLLGQPPYPIPVTQPDIIQMEYFIDTDPGIGLGTQVSISNSPDIGNLTIPVDISSLSQGIHRLFIRSQDANGSWSLTHSELFENIDPPYPLAQAFQNITALEYFINAAPPFGNGTPLTITPSADVSNQNFTIDVSSATPPGNHIVFFRSRDGLGRWSLSNGITFENSQFTYPVAPVIPDITAIEFFFDTDPGTGNGQAIAFSPTTDLVNANFTIDVSALTPGSHVFYIRSFSSQGWSQTNSSIVDTVLPVELLDFRASSSKGVVILEWETASELNNDFFDIERATGDDLHFEAIGTKDGRGTTSEITNYTFTDTDPVPGLAYYRLKQVDLDGAFEYSPVVPVNWHSPEPILLSIHPNPAGDKVYAEFNTSLNEKMEMIDLFGNVLWSTSVKGKKQLSFDTSTLKTGIYFIHVTSDRLNAIRKFIKK